MQALKYGLISASVALSFVPQAGLAQSTTQPLEILTVMDLSGSVWQKAKGVFKIDIFRDTAERLVSTRGDGIERGLLTFGRGANKKCIAPQMLLAPGAHESSTVSATVKRLVPEGRSPVAEALKLATQGFPQHERHIIMLLDGADNCKGDVCAVVDRIQKQAPNTHIHILGLGVSKRDQRALACAPQRTGGRFWIAQDRGGFLEAQADLEAFIGNLYTQDQSLVGNRSAVPDELALLQAALNEANEQNNALQTALKQAQTAPSVADPSTDTMREERSELLALIDQLQNRLSDKERQLADTQHALSKQQNRALPQSLDTRLIAGQQALERARQRAERLALETAILTEADDHLSQANTLLAEAKAEIIQLQQEQQDLQGQIISFSEQEQKSRGQVQELQAALVKARRQVAEAQGAKAALQTTLQQTIRQHSRDLAKVETALEAALANNTTLEQAQAEWQRERRQLLQNTAQNRGGERGADQADRVAFRLSETTPYHPLKELHWQFERILDPGATEGKGQGRRFKLPPYPGQYKITARLGDQRFEQIIDVGSAQESHTLVLNLGRLELKDIKKGADILITPDISASGINQASPIFASADQETWVTYLPPGAYTIEIQNGIDTILRHTSLNAGDDVAMSIQDATHSQASLNEN